ncbi:RsmE family RNA methyltransferase [Thermatribacter velox]|jgi:16S rRNA (uracil1498-N3)-methyltransferase|uniref:Ribosomal RNA small subunit methyltransferase E n=1 Tax=Thermatribacter velox TaxID=3039681 RepID=A0ABZ2YDP5_9BACT
MSKFFFYPFLSKAKDWIFLSEEETKHLMANRIKIGEKITLWNGRGLFLEARLEAYHGKRAKAKIEENWADKNINPVYRNGFQLFQALLKSTSRTDWLVEKATEVGVSCIYFFPTMHSLKKTISKSNLKRWKRIALSACKQSGYPFLPRIGFLKDIKKVAHKLESTVGTKLIADPQAQKTLSEYLKHSHSNTKDKQKNLLFLVGPEGDFSKSEKESFAKMGCIPVLLSRTILRSETAAIFGLAVIKSHFEDMHAHEICHQNFGL